TGPLRGRYPAMGSIAARFRGANDPDLPAFVGVAEPEITTWNSDIWNAGHLGSAYEPVKHSDLAGQLQMPATISVARAQDRDELRRQFDRFRSSLDTGATME